MDHLASHEEAIQEISDRRSIIMAVAIIAVGLLLCPGCEPLQTEDRTDLLLTLQVKSDQPVTGVIDAISKRAVALGASKNDVTQLDRKTVSVRLPGYNEGIKKAVRIMEKPAVLAFKLVDNKVDAAAAEKGDIPAEDEILYQMERNPRIGQISRKAYVVKKQVLMTGDVITDARAEPTLGGRTLVRIEFNSAGASEFERITSEHLNERLAIILDDRVYSAPVIKDRISSGAAVIEGMFTPEEAEELVLVLRCGPIAAPVEVVKSEWVEPTPGMALITAAARGDLAEVETLLRKGADIKAEDSEGKTALLSAAYEGHLPVVKLLLGRGADVNAKNKEGYTALMTAAAGGYPEVAKLLIESGADVNAKTKEGRTALMAASHKGHQEIATLLLDKGADVNAKDSQHLTSLMWAVDKGFIQEAKLLLERGADVNARDDKGQTALMFVSGAGNLELVKLLVGNGADVNAKDKRGCTVLMWAAAKGHEEVAKLLLEKRAHVNAKDNGGVTALMWAAGLGHAKVAKLLLDKGAHINEKDNFGTTALKRSKIGGHNELSKFLEAEGGRE